MNLDPVSQKWDVFSGQLNLEKKFTKAWLENKQQVREVKRGRENNWLASSKILGNQCNVSSGLKATAQWDGGDK